MLINRVSVLLLLTGHGALGSLAGARIRLGPLTANRQTAAVTQAFIASDFDLAADIGGHQEGIFHLDIIAWELTMIGSGYLIWAAVSWNDKQKRRYQNLEKNGYATQE